MKGAIIGDIIGSRFEWHNIKTKEFDLFTPDCKFTDDTVMTVAVGKALMDFERMFDRDINDVKDYSDLDDILTDHLLDYGNTYKHRGYGTRFKQWLRSAVPDPYGSWGNGSAMRASAAGMLGDGLTKSFIIGMYTAQPTHNHVEGMKGAGVTAGIINYAARLRIDSPFIDPTYDRVYLRDYARQYYDIPKLDDIRDEYRFDVSCMGTMPVALAAFLESTSFEDAIRNAISVGGDSDTIAAIAGSIAEAYYGVPEDLWEQAKTYLMPGLIRDVDNFYDYVENNRGKGVLHNEFNKM